MSVSSPSKQGGALLHNESEYAYMLEGLECISCGQGWSEVSPRARDWTFGHRCHNSKKNQTAREGRKVLEPRWDEQLEPGILQGDRWVAETRLVHHWRYIGVRHGALHACSCAQLRRGYRIHAPVKGVTKINAQRIFPTYNTYENRRNEEYRKCDGCDSLSPRYSEPRAPAGRCYTPRQKLRVVRFCDVLANAITASTTAMC
eukprot:1426326-Pyramimonas_sp.AAC.1